MQDLFIVHSSSLPSSTRVMGFRGEEALSKPYWFEVYIAFDGGAGAEVDPGDVIGTRATLELVQDLLAVPYWFHGIIAEMELIEELPRRSVFRMRLVPQVWSLELSLHSRVFTKKSIPEIIQSVLEDNGLDGEDFELRLTGTYAVEEHVCQYRESDLAFISRWMEHEGMYYFFEQQRAGEKLVITDDISSHSSLLRGPVRYHPSTGDESAQQALHTAALKHSTLAARVVISDYDYVKPALALVGSADVSPDGTAEWSVYGDRVFSAEGAKRVATFRAESLLARKRVLSARGTQRHIRTGYRFELEEHPRLDGEYMVISMSHIGRQLHGAPELDELLGGESNKSPEVYRVELEAIPSDVQYREPRHTPWPKIHGFENGVVDGAATSTYAQIDDHGRYATKLRFDEGPGKAGTASTWLRMAQPHGGGLEGFHFPLRKGTEVLVQFLDGDPDRPLIAAVLPNAATPSPVTAANNTKNVMQTGGSTRTEIEDAAGGQYMHNTTPPQNTSMWMGTDATSKGGHNVEAASDGSAGRSFGSYFDRFIGATKAEHVVDEVMRNYDANFNSTVTSNVEQNYSANQDSTIISNVARNVVGKLTDTVTGVVTRSWLATATHHITDDVNETFQANHALQVKGTQDVHVLAKGDFTSQAGKAETVNGALSKHVATSGYKLEVIPDASFHVVANIGIRADVAAVLSAPDTTVDGDTSVDIMGGSTVDAKSQSISMIGSSLIKLMSGGKIEITGGEVSVKGGNITVAAAAKMTVAAKAGQAVAAAAGNMTVNGGPMTEVKAGVIQLNLGGASPSGLGPLVDALIALDPNLANQLAELQKAGWVIQYGDPPGGGSYYDKGKKIMVIDGSLRSDPQGAANELGRLTNSLENPTTPVYAQEEPQSCVIASSRMIAETQTGRNIPESDLRAQSTAMGPGGYNAASGTDMTLGDDLLRQNGVSNASEFGPLSIDELDAATANGDPAMVRLQHAGGGGHAVVVDGVSTAPDGTQMITIRDPGGTGTSQTMPVTQFQTDYYGNGSGTTYDGRGITTNGGG